MKKIYLFLLLVLTITPLIKAQTCTNETDKTIVRARQYNVPCTNFIARDSVILRPGFSFSSIYNGQNQIVELTWTYSSLTAGWYPYATINSTTSSGIALPTGHTYNNFISSIFDLASKLKTALGVNWNVNALSPNGSSMTIHVENLSAFSYNSSNKNFESASLVQSYQAPGTAATFDATIDNRMLLGADYLSNASIPDLTTRVADTNLPFGITQGNFDVSSTGAANYQIPIIVPKGLGSLVPSLSIAYNSQSGNGLLGWGCNLSGLSSISRVAKNSYNDNEIKGLTIDVDDRFMLDGNRLILTSGTYGSAEAVYQTEKETFAYIVSKGLYGTNSPDHFEVYSKDGTKYVYGSSDGRTVYTSGSKSAIVSWNLASVEDIYGNTINYTYEQDGLATYIKTITYGTNKGGYGTLSTVEFFYESRIDPINLHVYPLNGQVKRVLNKIVTRTGDQVLRVYDFDFTKDVFTRLSKITESNGKGESLNPTYFKWGDYTNTIVTTTLPLTFPNSLPGHTINESLYTGVDLNGDGRTDMVQTLYNDRDAAKNYGVAISCFYNNSTTGTPSFSAASTPISLDANIHTWVKDVNGNLIFEHTSSVPRVITGDIDGDGKPNIISPYIVTGKSDNKIIDFRIVSFETNSLTSLGVQNIQSGGTNNPPSYTVADFNNDGYDEIIYIENWALPSNGFFPGRMYLPKTKQWVDFNVLKPTTLGVDDYNPGPIIPGDYNSDGLIDLLVTSKNGYKILINKGGDNGYGRPVFESTDYYLSFNSENSCISPGDFNGDGLQDFILCKSNSTNWRLALNNGDMTFSIVSLPNITLDQYSDYESARRDNSIVTDFDNDGKSDIIVFDSHDGKYDIQWFKSTGTGMTKVYGAHSDTDDYAISSNGLYTMGDFNGDGRLELLNSGWNCMVGGSITSDWYMYTAPNFNYDIGKITSVSNSLGKRIDIAYTGTAAKTNYSVDGTAPSYPLARLSGGAYLVKQTTIQSGVADPMVQTFNYRNGVVDLQQGFLGFDKFTVTNTNTKAITEEYYEFLLKYGTYEYREPFLTSSKNYYNTKLLSETNTPLSSYSITPLANGPKHVFMYPTVSSSTDYLKQTITTSTTSKDADGNVLTSTSQSADLNTPSTAVASQTTKYNGYAQRITTNPNRFKNAPDNMVVEQTHKDTPGKFSVTTAFEYNSSNGSLGKKKNYAGTTKELVTSYTYNEVGNVLTTTSGDRKDSIVYTTDKRFVAKTYNSLKQYSEADYNIWGNIITQWDINRLKSTYTYDNWGSAVGVTMPDGRSVVSYKNWYDKGNATSYKPTTNTVYYTCSYDEDNHFISAEYFDLAGHSLRKAVGGFNGRVMYTDINYNAKGQVMSVSDPYLSTGSATKWTANIYDDYGRLHIQALPNDVIVNTSYSDDNQRIITTNYSTGEIYTKQYDAAGLLTTAIDPGGSISYTYFSTGKPKNIQPAGGVGATTITYYDETGAQETLTDPNTGTNTYDYNAFGELTSQTNGNAKNTIITYDKLGRIETKTLGTVVTTYYYDPVGALGKVDHISKTDGSGMSYTYDELARVIEETRSKNTDELKYKYAYDGKSRVNKLTYPGNMALIYGYNSISGDLMSISKDGTAIWSLGTTSTDVNDLGQTLKVTMGNGKITNYGYDTQNRLNSISAANIINFSYQFNNKQQLEYRDERMYDGTSMVGFKENFTYDGVNRLWTATKDNGNTPLTMVYKTGVNDRIDNKSDVGAYVYNETTNHCIDKLNTVSGYTPSQHDLTYTDEGKTATIRETNNGAVNKTLTLDYGIDGQRFKTDYVQNGTTTTRYYFNTYEKEGVKQLNYIYAGSQLIAIFEQNSTSGDKMHYVYTDRQGSLRCITSDNGTIEQRLSFDAWGNRRNYATGVKLTDTELAAATALTSRGYTGHEHLDGLGLINMNGRVYDPALGIFISPDNFVQQPTNSQNFNRYTYCLNNPLMYTDPSGDIFFFIPQISYSQKGGLSIGFTVGIGIPKALSAQISTGYNFKSESFYVQGGVSAASVTLYGGWGNKSGWYGGISAGLGFGDCPVSTNATSVGISYSQNGGWGGNISAFQYNQHSGWSYDLSVSASLRVYYNPDPVSEFKSTNEIGYDPEEFSNKNAKGFHDKNFGTTDGLDNIIADGSELPKIDGYSYCYAEDRGSYLNLSDPKNPKFADGVTVGDRFSLEHIHSKIFLGRSAFTSSDKLYLVMGHERMHVLQNYYNLKNSDKKEAAAYVWTYLNAFRFRDWDGNLRFDYSSQLFKYLPYYDSKYYKF